ncbi:HD-GYP domain-containing protein [Anaerosalibacter bizertensis]|uniref:HD-GYP domain-containing protein n=1 Tax=Anaerosalibacter bizertensis TaxID=932217 RepID=UPI0018A6BED4|nr:HD-GYP domain-containing protein [Anaerosalibacter bizertensis]
MSVKLDINSSIWIRSQCSTVKKELEETEKKICKILDYDICASLLFNDSRNIAINKSTYAKTLHDKKSIFPNIIFFKKDPDNKLNELIRTKDIVENYYIEEKCKTLEEVISEVFIPIFNSQGDTMILIGCIYLGSYSKKRFLEEVLLEDTMLNEYISKISKLLTLSLLKFEQMENVMNMINIFTELIKQKDHFLPNHNYNVANWCKIIGIELGLSHQELDKLYLAGLLHDIGKVMIDFNIVNKPDRLTEEEYEIIKEHPIYSYIISKYLLGHIPKLNDVPEIVKHHHERYDGKGYPDGLKGEEVLLSSYIVGISDAVDAMMSNRAYKKAMPLNTVISELYRNKGTQFHPQLVDIMVKRLAKAEEQFEKILENTINLSSLIVSYKEDIFILEGSLMNIDNCYMFKPFEKFLIEDFELSKVMDVEIVIKDLTNLHHYHVKVEDFKDDTFYISHLQLIPLSNTFNLLWSIEGILYHPIDNKEMPIEIMRIGGDAFSFAIRGDIAEEIPYGKPLKAKILFEEYDIDISGNIVKGYDFGPYKYFDFYYTNIPDFKRDMIFRQLFRKQIELRKAILEYKS